jgi:hypothetical protein
MEPRPESEVESAPVPTGVWKLVAPDYAELDSLWRNRLPFVLWPVCGKPLLTYWLDEAVRLQVESVEIVALDRPHLIRAWLDHRDMWSRSIVVKSQVYADGVPGHLMDTLPGCAVTATPRDGAALLLHWLDLQKQALALRDQGLIHLDAEVQPGVWIGPGAQVPSSAQLTAPCWIGSYVRIGENCRLGPEAYIGHSSFLDTDVEVREAAVCSDTYVGSHTSLCRMVVQGGLLLDVAKGVAVEVAESFVLSDLRPTQRRSRWGVRALAFLASPVLSLVARLLARGQSPRQTEVRLGRNLSCLLTTYPSGPLLVRRAPWLREVAAGRLSLIGILPRSPADWENLDPDTRSLFEGAAVGVFALSDLYGCNTPGSPEELTHALFQVGAPRGEGHKLAARSLVPIALSTPVSS